jgi:hypothetical protein
MSVVLGLLLCLTPLFTAEGAIVRGASHYRANVSGLECS